MRVSRSNATRASPGVSLAGSRRPAASGSPCSTTTRQIERDAVAVMLAAGSLAPACGPVAAQMRFADRRNILNSAGLELDRLGVAADRLVGTQHQRPGRERAVRGVRRHRRRRAVPARDARPGGRLRRDLLRVLRGRRPGLAGTGARLARALRAPRAVVYHHHSATAAHGSPAKLYLVGRNRVRTLAKNATVGMLLVQRRRGWSPTTPRTSLYASIGGRTLAPLRAASQGLREWRAYRRAGRRTAARCACSARWASDGRCGVIGATPTSKAAKRSVR